MQAAQNMIRRGASEGGMAPYVFQRHERLHSFEQALNFACFHGMNRQERRHLQAALYNKEG